MRLNVKALALTSAILVGVGLFLATWWLIILEGSGATTTIFNRVYLGYTITPLGSIIGLVWGFVDGLICGAIFAWLYNALLPKASAA
ncbi:hypothetical protein CEE37_05275 [candidate division LCP-89 bacterium B3_LCP]|uniref:Membrane-associated protein n=1 Tax=candidate division LCP-89 bacterium B3_LCP TaxID=2012998 RepID=A0A532V1S1_UNCL8|nr:MAG: hypothetical protein CEE37_05275 [candidate division LCP-89 bacterium B3_LCP]